MPLQTQDFINFFKYYLPLLPLWADLIINDMIKLKENQMKCTKFDIQHYPLPQASQPSGTALEPLEQMNSVLLASNFSWSRNYTEQTYIKFHWMNSNWNPINFPVQLSYFPPFTYWKILWVFFPKILPKTLIICFHNIYHTKINWKPCDVTYIPGFSQLNSEGKQLPVRKLRIKLQGQ